MGGAPSLLPPPESRQKDTSPTGQQYQGGPHSLPPPPKSRQKDTSFDRSSEDDQICICIPYVILYLYPFL